MDNITIIVEAEEPFPFAYAQEASDNLILLYDGYDEENKQKLFHWEDPDGKIADPPVYAAEAITKMSEYLDSLKEKQS